MSNNNTFIKYSLRLYIKSQGAESGPPLGTILSNIGVNAVNFCKEFNGELNVCKMVVEYDTSYAKNCKEPTAEEVRKKDEANFCDHFKPKAGAYVAKNVAEIDKAKSALEDLFRK